MKTDAKRKVPEKYEKIFSQYRGLRSDLIPVLQSIQDEEGYVPSEAISETARFLNIPRSSVYGVVTFYAQFYLTPQGRNKIKVCLGTACHVRGASDIMKAVEKKLGIKAGESTADFEFNVEKVACFGSCALAPVVVVNGKVYGNVTPDQALEILDNLSK
jgi:NADH-quinone oxidoreductase E subunit